MQEQRPTRADRRSVNRSNLGLKLGLGLLALTCCIKLCVVTIALNNKHVDLSRKAEPCVLCDFIKFNPTTMSETKTRTVFISKAELLDLETSAIPGGNIPTLMCDVLNFMSAPRPRSIYSSRPNDGFNVVSRPRGSRGGCRRYFYRRSVQNRLNQQSINEGLDLQLQQNNCLASRRRPASENSDKINKNSGTSLLLQNAQSVCNKALKVNEYIQEQDVSFLALTETWLEDGDTVTVNELCPNGYRFIGKNRDSRGGGVGLVYKSEFSVSPTKNNDHVYKSFEHISVKIGDATGAPWCLTVLYRPPPSKKNQLKESDFLEDIEELLEELSELSQPIFIVGDFNVHFEDEQAPSTRNFRDILDVFDLEQHVMSPTHNKGHCLDLVITRRAEVLLKSVTILQKNFSDHRGVLCDITYKSKKVNHELITFRKIRQINAAEFGNDVNNSIQQLPQDCDSLVEFYTDTMNNLIDKHAPLLTKTMTTRKPKPWYNDEIHRERQIRRRLERKWLKTKNHNDEARLENQREKVVDLIKKTKQMYYTEKLACGSLCTVFQCIGQLMHNQNKVLPNHESKQQLAEQFVNFFHTKVCNIRAEIDLSSENDMSPYTCDLQTEHTIHEFHPVSNTELSSIIKRTKSKSCSLDPIPTWLLKDDQVLDAAIPVLCKIVNQSLQEGMVPQSLKRALVTPIPKKQNMDANLLANYRPVSNLPYVGKVIEKVVSAQLTKYLSANNLLDPLQSAYSAGHSTETAIVKVQNDIKLSIDSGEGVLLAMLDLSSAFDTLDHGVLIHRLEQSFGLQGVVINWIKSYIADRKMCVAIDKDFSKSVDLSIGVPQGSILGPLFFVLYIAPLKKIMNKYDVWYHCYADDTQLYTSFRANDALQMKLATQKLEQCIAEVRDWLTANSLKLNEAKTEFVIFASPYYYKQILDFQPSITIGQTVIQPSHVVRNLGVYMDSTLKMNEHIKRIARSMHFYIRMIRKISHYLSNTAKVRAVVALVLSRLDYANATLAGCSSHCLKMLQVAQNHAARFLTNTSRYESAKPSLRTLHWLPVTHRVNFKCMCLVYKCMNNLVVPVYIKSMFVPYRSERTLRSSADTLKLAEPVTKLQYGNMAFSNCAARHWNKLPIHIRSSDTLSAFKKQLKTYMFIDAYK